MSKLRIPESVEAVRLTLAEAARAGTAIRCPDCGQPARASQALAGKNAGGQPIAAAFWVKVVCSSFCGAKLQPASLTVDAVGPASGPSSGRVVRPLNHVVGHFIRCPQPDCMARALAVWRDDRRLTGHGVECPVHQVRAYPPETPVEVLS